MQRLDGRVAVVTGAAGYLGSVLVTTLAACGARVVATDVVDGWDTSPEERERVARLAHDVRDLARWHEVLAEAERRFGPPSVLVNNAAVVRGVQLRPTQLRVEPIETLSEADYRGVVDVNQVGTFLGIKAAIGPMRRAGGGSIVNIASIDGIIAREGIAGYVSTKFAIRGLTKVAALELGRDAIRVNAVCPGLITTPRLPEVRAALVADLPLPRCAKPEEIAALVVFLASEESGYATGSEFVMDGGYTAR